ncbi:hypothetical protein LCGC14_1897330, partial [marine sediment metagenome]
LEAGILSQAEADKLAAVEQSRLDVINVDDFDPADLLAGKAARNSVKKEADAA